MKIHYLEALDGTKLFSFNRHDFREYTDKEGNYYMIDGGFDYIKQGGDKGVIKYAEIKDIIKEVRDSFIWGRNFDENGNRLEKTEHIKLKDLGTEHIMMILRYFTVRLDEQGYAINRNWAIVHLIFIEELLYRQKNN